jgi:ketosteroid isomerase-like protein
MFSEQSAEGEYYPYHPWNQFGDNRLTKRGIEICHRLFDLGKSEMAVALLTRLSLLAAKKRKKMWVQLGGKARKKVDIDALPYRKRSRRRIVEPVLYTKDAMMFGSTAQLFTGTDGVRTYFSKLPAGIKVKMGNQQAIAHGPDLLFSSGFADFTLANGTVLPYRLTLALVKVDGKWLVAQHHGSPVPT